MQPQLKFSEDGNKQIKSVWLIALLALVALYILFRLWRLTTLCLWFDEIFSVHAARHGFSELFSFVAQDLIHPPLFYLLLKIWILIGGESLLWLRLFPLLFAAVAVVPFWFLCRELRLPIQTIALAFLFLAVNGSLIKYAQEVRMYSPLFCLSLFSLWLFVKFFNSLENRILIALTIVNLLLIYTHYFGWLVVLTEILFFMFFGKEKKKEFLFSFIALVFAFAPWAFAVIKIATANKGLHQNIGWTAKPTLQSLIEFALLLNQPFYFQMSSTDAVYLKFITPPIALICFIATGFLLIQLLKVKDNKNLIILFFFFAFLPVVTAFTASNLTEFSFWGTRHLIIVFAPFAILSAVAIQFFRLPLLKDTLVYLLISFFAFALLAHAIRKINQPIWCAWETLAEQVKETEQSTKIYASEELIAYHLWFALRESDKDKFQIVALKNIPDLKEDTAYFLPRRFYDVTIQNADSINEKIFFLAFRGTESDEEKEPLKFLKEKGYQASVPFEIKLKDGTAFLVLMSKKQ